MILNVKDAPMISAITVATAAELTARVIQRTAGNDIANSINGSQVTKDRLVMLITNEIVKNIKKD